VTRDPLHLTLLRHGRSKADDEKVCGGRYDDPLTSEGLEQATKLARYWQKHPPGFEHIVCSSLQRAKQTANIIAEMLEMNIEVSDLWMERDNGPLAGMHFEEANKRYPNRNLRGRYELYVSDGGESYMAMMRRAQLGIEKLMQSECFSRGSRWNFECGITRYAGNQQSNVFFWGYKVCSSHHVPQ
jgi:2,3-bisphosphoglycerate-dependent phosphoglycerate mutase